MNTDATEFPWATAIMAVIAIVIVIVGGAVVIWGEPGTLSFQDYLNDLEKFGVAVGLLGVGRGIRSGLKNRP